MAERPILRQGDSGVHVTELQRALDIPWLADDGVFGPATAAVVRAYRISKGLGDDDVVDPQMWAELGVDDYDGV